MNFEVREISPVLVEIHASIPWDTVRSDLEKRFVALTRTARIKGFRPGKVPLTVVKNLFRPQVENEATTELMNEAIRKVVTEQKIFLAASPLVDRPAVETGKDFAFIARCERQPKITSVDTAGIEIYRELDVVGDAEVDAAIERLRNERATVREPEPLRPAKATDVVTVSFTVTVDGATREDLSSNEHTLELGAGGTLKEIEEALTGASVGDTRAATVTFPPTHGNASLRDKTAIFTLKVEGLKEKVLPNVDDEFAEDCGEKTVAELREATRARLVAAAATRSEQAIKEQLVAALCEKNPVAVPPTSVQEEAEELRAQLDRFARMVGAPPPPEMQQDALRRAEQKVRAGLLFGALLELQGITLTDADVDARMQQMAEETKRPVARIRAEHADPQRMSQLRSRILETKIVDYLRGQAKILDGKRPAPAEGA